MLPSRWQLRWRIPGGWLVASATASVRTILRWKRIRNSIFLEWGSRSWKACHLDPGIGVTIKMEYSWRWEGWLCYCVSLDYFVFEEKEEEYIPELRIKMEASWQMEGYLCYCVSLDYFVMKEEGLRIKMTIKMEASCQMEGWLWQFWQLWCVHLLLTAKNTNLLTA